MDRGLNAGRGASILKDTIAEMTHAEVAEALGRGAIALWGCGVAEQHGPHLPTGTDIYIPSARLHLVRRMLADHGIEARIIPPFYWGGEPCLGQFSGLDQGAPRDDDCPDGRT